MDAKADLRLTDRQGATPLQLARSRGYAAMVKMLEQARAKVPAASSLRAGGRATRVNLQARLHAGQSQKVAVVVHEQAVLFQRNGGNQTVGGLAHGKATLPGASRDGARQPPTASTVTDNGHAVPSLERPKREGP